MKENIEEKIKEFDEIIKKYPTVKEFYLGRAKLYEELKEYKKAIEDYKRACIQYIWYDVVSICKRNRLYKEIEDFYTNAINSDKNNVKNYFCRAYFYMNIEEYKKALSDCKKGLRLSPKNESLLELEEILFEKLNKHKYIKTGNIIFNRKKIIDTGPAKYSKVNQSKKAFINAIKML